MKDAIEVNVHKTCFHFIMKFLLLWYDLDFKEIIMNFRKFKLLKPIHLILQNNSNSHLILNCLSSKQINSSNLYDLNPL